MKENEELIKQGGIYILYNTNIISKYKHCFGE